MCPWQTCYNSLLWMCTLKKLQQTNKQNKNTHTNKHPYKQTNKNNKQTNKHLHYVRVWSPKLATQWHRMGEQTKKIIQASDNTMALIDTNWSSFLCIDFINAVNTLSISQAFRSLCTSVGYSSIVVILLSEVALCFVNTCFCFITSLFCSCLSFLQEERDVAPW